jgi:metal-sulfur cluster biosynthetic enzyme
VSDTSDLTVALDTVRDPELDTSIVELGFVTRAWIEDGGTAHVRLRLPTFFCAPNFAFLMVADAYDAVSRLADVVNADIVLEDHFAANEINAGVAARAGFMGAFDGLAENELDDLRRQFLRKAMLAAQDRVIRPLLAGGMNVDELAALRLGDIPPSADLDRLRARRLELSISSDDGDPLLVDVGGARVGRGDVRVHLRRSRTVRISMEANSDYCRQLLTLRNHPSGATAAIPASP